MFREITKLLLFIVIWALPVVTSLLWQDKWLLLLFFISIFVTSSIFNHYESVTRTENHLDEIDEEEVED